MKADHIFELSVEGRAIEHYMPDAVEQDEDALWMRRALAAASEAWTRDEVPIGACVVTGNGTLLGVAGNRTRSDCDPTAHAEIVALREAAHIFGNYRLTEAIVYSTIEPCAMCAGALIQARVKRLVYGARDERFGAVESQFRICETGSLNHRVEITSGVLEAECRSIMQEFFRARRTTKGEGMK
jgi:tRNA(adenine34) deaminase